MQRSKAIGSRAAVRDGMLVKLGSLTSDLLTMRRSSARCPSCDAGEARAWGQTKGFGVSENDYPRKVESMTNPERLDVETAEELLQGIRALRADIQALPERIESSLAKKLKRVLWAIVILVVGNWLVDWLTRISWK